MEGYVVSYEYQSSGNEVCEGVTSGEVRVEGVGVTEWLLNGLEEGTVYDIRVAASNSAGDGEPSEPSNVYTKEAGIVHVPLCGEWLGLCSEIIIVMSTSTNG